MLGDLFDWRQERDAYLASPGVKEQSLNSASQKGAEKIAPSVKTIRAAILRCLHEHGPLAADEAADLLHLDILSVRPRFSEARAAGQIVATDERRPSSRNTPQTVWRLVSQL